VNTETVLKLGIIDRIHFNQHHKKLILWLLKRSINNSSHISSVIDRLLNIYYTENKNSYIKSREVAQLLMTEKNFCEKKFDRFIFNSIDDENFDIKDFIEGCYSDNNSLNNLALIIKGVSSSVFSRFTSVLIENNFFMIKRDDIVRSVAKKIITDFKSEDKSLNGTAMIYLEMIFSLNPTVRTIMLIEGFIYISEWIGLQSEVILNELISQESLNIDNPLFEAVFFEGIDKDLLNEEIISINRTDSVEDKRSGMVKIIEDGSVSLKKFFTESIAISSNLYDIEMSGLTMEDLRGRFSSGQMNLLISVFRKKTGFLSTAVYGNPYYEKLLDRFFALFVTNNGLEAVTKGFDNRENSIPPLTDSGEVYSEDADKVIHDLDVVHNIENSNQSIDNGLIKAEIVNDNSNQVKPEIIIGPKDDKPREIITNVDPSSYIISLINEEDFELL